MRLRKHHTTRYEEMIYERVKRSNIKEVCQEEGLGWDEVNSIFEAEILNPLTKLYI